MSLFEDLNITFEDKVILLDIDGTLVSDSQNVISIRAKDKVRALLLKNKVFLCSNKKDLKRNRNIAEELGVSFIESPYRKPSKKILRYIDQTHHHKLIVIGDKYLTDGLFAKRIEAPFVKVTRLQDSSESVLTKLIYLADDICFSLSTLL